jgi:hypothetical protein
MFGKLVLMGSVVAASLLVASSAQAEGRCPDGFLPTGGGTAGWIGCAPYYNPNTENASPDPEPSRPSVSSYYDPKFTALQFQSASAMIDLQQQAKLLQDPKYLKYISGSWNLFPTSRLAGVKPGSYCVASFFKASMDPAAKKAPVMINLVGPGGDYKGVLLTFAAADIPRPKTMKTITVTLIQNNDPPATVKAFNYTMPNLPFGVIAFAVPTIDGALAGIEDVQNFDVKIDGKSVAKTMWHSGLKMKDEFRKCLNGKSYSLTEIDIVPERLKT